MIFLLAYWATLGLTFSGVVAIVNHANKAMSDAIHWSKEQRGWEN